MRVNRIPTSLRKAIIGDLVEKQAGDEAVVAVHQSPPPPVASRIITHQPAPSVPKQRPEGNAKPLRGTKRTRYGKPVLCDRRRF